MKVPGARLQRPKTPGSITNTIVIQPVMGVPLFASITCITLPNLRHIRSKSGGHSRDKCDLQEVIRDESNTAQATDNGRCWHQHDDECDGAR